MTIEHHRLARPGASSPTARFSPGVRAGQFVQVAGQGALDPKSGTVLHAGEAAAQTTATLEGVEAILADGGASIRDVIMMRVYLTDTSQFPAMNSAYDAFMTERLGDAVPPARTTVFVDLALDGMVVEIDALAVVGTT